MFFKLPSAWWSGVRLHEITVEKCVVSVRHRWINQNPFKSMFWAVQGMAAEMTQPPSGSANCFGEARVLHLCTELQFKNGLNP